MSTATATPSPTSTTGIAPPASSSPGGNNGGAGSSSPLLFFVALGFGVVFTNLWFVAFDCHTSAAY